MTESTQAPPFTVLASLPSLAKNVGCVGVSKTDAAGDKELLIRVEGDSLLWQHGESCASISRSCVKGVSLVPLSNNGEQFAAIALSFANAKSEIVRYRLVTSHISELTWLQGLATEVAGMLGVEIKDELR
jgi:hypothetical protein